MLFCELSYVFWTFYNRKESPKSPFLHSLLTKACPSLLKSYTTIQLARFYSPNENWSRAQKLSGKVPEISLSQMFQQKVLACWPATAPYGTQCDHPTGICASNTRSVRSAPNPPALLCGTRGSRGIETYLDENCIGQWNDNICGSPCAENILFNVGGPLRNAEVSALRLVRMDVNVSVKSSCSHHAPTYRSNLMEGELFQRMLVLDNNTKPMWKLFSSV